MNNRYRINFIPNGGGLAVVTDTLTGREGVYYLNGRHKSGPLSGCSAFVRSNVRF